jgi:thiosulfate dehydrogenase [quinone] large subunit
MLGLFTRLGCWGAMAMLALFYLSAIPTTGAPVSGQEGEYMLVSKNLIELVAVAVILAFRTERVAGLDVLRNRE